MDLPAPLKDFLYVSRRCPRCFEKIYLGACDIVDQGNTVLEAAPTGELELMTACLYPKPLLPGNWYTLPGRRCKECQYRMPYNIERVPNIILPIIGDGLSGKSHYFGAFIHQLHRGNHYNVKCLTQDLEVQYQKVYQTNAEMPRTPAAGSHVEPLIYELSVPPRGKPFNLMLYDAAGENFSEDAKLVDIGRFIFHANALIFVADPVIMDPIFQELDPTIQTVLNAQYAGKRKEWAVPAQRLNGVKHFFSYRSKASFSRPLAVMISKSDLLRGILTPQNPQPNRHISWLSELKALDTVLNDLDLQYPNDVDISAIDKVDKLVRKLIEKIDKENLKSATDVFKNVKFFATSATGELPKKRTFTNPTPSRCLDPVFWILYNLGL